MNTRAMMGALYQFAIPRSTKVNSKVSIIGTNLLYAEYRKTLPSITERSAATRCLKRRIE